MKLTLKEITDKLSHSQIQEFAKEYNIGYERAKIGLSEYIHSLQ